MGQVHIAYCSVCLSNVNVYAVNLLRSRIKRWGKHSFIFFSGCVVRWHKNFRGVEIFFIFFIAVACSFKAVSVVNPSNPKTVCSKHQSFKLAGC